MTRRIVLGGALMVVAVALVGCASGDATTTAVTVAQAAAVGDPLRGYEIWDDGGDVINTACSHCHSVDGTENTNAFTGPSFKGINRRAGATVDGLSAEEYLNQSILDPRAYIVAGFAGGGKMPNSYQFLLSDEDVDDLVAFLLGL